MVSETLVKQRRQCDRPIEALHRLTLAHQLAGAKNDIPGALAMAGPVQERESKRPFIERIRSVTTSWHRAASIMQLSLHD